MESRSPESVKIVTNWVKSVKIVMNSVKIVHITNELDEIGENNDEFGEISCHLKNLTFSGPKPCFSPLKIGS